MATDVRTAEKFLTYDGDCPMCIGTVGWLVRRGLVRPDQTRANYDLDESDAELARAAGIRNQLVVIDPRTRETRVGTAGLLWVIGDTPGYRGLTRFLSLPGVRHVLNFGYQAISYNRRIISPPKHQIVCDCEPEVTVYRRLTLALPAALLAVAIAGGFGASAVAGCQVAAPWQGAVALAAVVVGCGIVLSAAALALLGGPRALDYVAHLAVTVLRGMLILVPGAALLWALPRPAAAVLTLLSLMYCFSHTFRLQVARARVQSLSLGWVAAWIAVSLAAFAAALAWILRDAF